MNNDFGYIGADALYDNNIFNQQWTRTFSQIYPNYNSFKSDYEAIGLKMLEFSDVDTMRNIYILLLGRYAHTATFSINEDEFKIQLMTKIMTYGPEFEKKMMIQKSLLSKTEDDLTRSSSAIYNTAINPSQPLKLTSDTDKVKTINQQNTTQHIRSFLDGYEYLLNLLDTNLVDEFIDKFKDLFNPFVKTNVPLWYITHKEN